MSISQWTTKLASLAAVLVMATVASAQRNGPAQPYNSVRFQPFIEPLAFDPDYQFFAPAEVGNFGNGWQAKTGWFTKYDRTYMLYSRPELEQSSNQMDGGWGHRFSIGYMTPDGHGWSVEGVDMSGPNEANRLFIEQINRFNDDDDPNGGNNQGGGGGGGGNNNQQQDAVYPVSDRNHPETDARHFESINTLNKLSMSGFELNKTFRLKRLHNGSYLEPFLGFRYHLANDYHRDDSYRRLDELTFVPTLPQPNTNDTVEEIIINRSNWENHMVGGHLGVHWFIQQPSWQFSSDLRFFAAQNFQSLNQSSHTQYIIYDGVTQGADITTRSDSVTYNYANDDEFVWGMDVRAEAAYELTRDVSLTVGVQVIHFVQGVARGNMVGVNEEDLTIVGGTFG